MLGGSTLEGLRLHTLVRLRWLAVVGQTGAVLFVNFVLEFPLPLGPCLAVIALSAWLNIFLSLRWRSSVRLRNRYAAGMLAYDILQLAALLYLTGGLENPFAFLFLVPVTVSATTLPSRWTIWLAAIAAVVVTLLAIHHLPLPWRPGRTLNLPSVFIAGMWAAINCGVIFTALYASRIAREAREMSGALSATEAILAREQQLHALDGLAAAAAHELGTPLSTIALVAKELKRELPDDERVRDDLDLLMSQAERCRDILAQLANRDAQSDAMFAQSNLTVMIEEILEPLRGPDVDIAVDARPTDADALSDMGQPAIPRNPAIKYGLGNLLENAVDFASRAVQVDIRWDRTSIDLTILDDGPGVAQDVIDRLGDPYVTTRRGFGAGQPVAQDAGHQGMGLGFFIAKTLLERSGARVELANRDNGVSGAIVQISWPRSAIEVVP